MSDNRSIEFIQRHIGPSEDDQNKMLSYLGHSSMEEFINKIVPQKIIETKNFDYIEKFKIFYWDF